jgi:nucleoside phosphorylase
MIAVSFALPAESSAFVREMDASRYRQFRHGKISGIEVVVVHTGVGRRTCEKRLTSFLQKERPQIFISSGFCGGTADEHRPGDLVLAENFSAPDLVNRTRKILPGARCGKMFSADEVVDAALDRYKLGREHGAIAIDMETEPIARLVGQASIPMLTLRVISDSPTAPFPAPPEVLFNFEKQRTKLLTLFGYLARNPAAIARLMNFSKQVSYARTKLAEALCAVIRQL